MNWLYNRQRDRWKPPAMLAKALDQSGDIAGTLKGYLEEAKRKTEELQKTLPTRVFEK